MIRRVVLAFVATSGLWCGSLASIATAQGLIWSLPEDGTWVRFEGTYKNQETRPNADEGDLELQWTRWLTVSSVGRENQMVGGKEVACRWVEMKLETGKSTAEGVDTGRFGTHIYKVLIPEHRVIGKVMDEDNIPVTFLPIIKGYRKLGDRPAKAVKEKVLSVSPMISALDHYRDLKALTKEPEPLDITLGNVLARIYKGQVLHVTDVSRSSNTAEIALSEEVPFGIAKWTVTIEREEKDRLESEETFHRTATIDVEMQAAETGTGARSELPNLN